MGELGQNQVIKVQLVSNFDQLGSFRVNLGHPGSF